jgi:hypothetical protein
VDAALALLTDFDWLMAHLAGTPAVSAVTGPVAHSALSDDDQQRR